MHGQQNIKFIIFAAVATFQVKNEISAALYMFWRFWKKYIVKNVWWCLSFSEHVWCFW
jgi:hypothetical protein